MARHIKPQRFSTGYGENNPRVPVDDWRYFWIASLRFVTKDSSAICNKTHVGHKATIEAGFVAGSHEIVAESTLSALITAFVFPHRT